MAIPTFDIGDAVDVQMLFYSDAAKTTLADPTAVSLRVRKPDGTATDYSYGGAGTVTKSATGTYVQLITVDQAGRWWFRWAGTGAVATVEESEFRVRERRV
jgi:hypothetical protein